MDILILTFQPPVRQTVTVELVEYVTWGPVSVGTRPCVPDTPTLCVVLTALSTPATVSSTDRPVYTTNTSRWTLREPPVPIRRKIHRQLCPPKITR